MLVVYGLPDQLASEACRAWLRDNKINFTFVEVTEQHNFIKRIPTLVISDLKGGNLVYHGFNAEAKTFIINNKEKIK